MLEIVAKMSLECCLLVLIDDHLKVEDFKSLTVRWSFIVQSQAVSSPPVEQQGAKQVILV